MADQIFPGPCDPITGCPPPTEIDCIEINKVYDYCFQQDIFQNICLAIPASCVGIATGATATVSATCIVGSTSPAVTPGFVNAAFGIALTVSFTITTSGTISCTGTTTATFVKIVTLCGPAGTFQDCVVESAVTGPVTIIGATVCTSVIICSTFQSLALVKILVPTYGFCIPAPCTTGGLPPCPPGTLFPPQCT